MKNEHEKTLALFTDVILTSGAFNNVKVIGITGSVGRGEKTILDKSLNDVDFFVVADSCEPTAKSEVEERLIELTEAKFTDILFVNSRKFRRNLNARMIDQYLFDLVRCHLLLHADNVFKTTLKQAHKREYQVSHRSAVTVLFTRLWCLTGPYDVVNSEIRPRDVYFTNYQMSKAIGAIIDAILIHEQLYSTPNPATKKRAFQESAFCRRHQKLMQVLHEQQGDPKIEFAAFHKVLVQTYVFALDYVIGHKISFFWHFPMPKALLMSFVHREKRKYVQNMIRRYYTLRLVRDFYASQDGQTLKRLTDLFERIYNEVMG